MEHYCKKLMCELKDCPRHYKNIKPTDMNITIAHLEGNPLYCIKRDWNNNQYKEEKDA